jgi:hypothetical protein
MAIDAGTARHGLVPGMRVRLPAMPEWGIGQVQSAHGTRVVVTFENAGKRVVETDSATLVPVADDATSGP